MTIQRNNLTDVAILNGEHAEHNDGIVAPLDGSHEALTTSGSRFADGAADASRGPLGIDGKAAASSQEVLAKLALGANNERLEELRPDLVNALRELVVQYREEGRRERDAAIAVAHGGTLQTRLKRAAKWFAIGAIAATATLALTHP